MLSRFHADPQLLRIRLVSEIDASGRISLVLTFAGPLRELDEPARSPPA